MLSKLYKLKMIIKINKIGFSLLKGKGMVPGRVETWRRFIHG